MADIDVNSLEPNSHKYKAEKANGGNKKEPGSREKVSPGLGIMRKLLMKFRSYLKMV